MNTDVSAWDYLRRSEDLRDIGRDEASFEALCEGLAHFPTDSTLLCAVASSHLRRGDASLADQATRAAIRFHPEHARAHAIRAEALRRLGRRPDALVESRRAHELAPLDDYVALIRSRVLSGAGETSEAIDVANSVLASRPNSLLGHCAHVEIALDKTRVTRVDPLYLIGMTLITRGAALVFFGIRWLYLRLRNRRILAAADEHMAAALRLAPHEPSVLILASEVLRLRGRWFGALDRRVAAARQDLTRSSIDELVPDTRRRLVVGELVAVLLLAYALHACILFGGRWALLAGAMTLVAPSVWWAWDRRRRARRVLPIGLANELRDDITMWIGPVLAAIAAVPFVAYAVGVIG